MIEIRLLNWRFRFIIDLKLPSDLAIPVQHIYLKLLNKPLHLAVPVHHIS